MTKRFYLGMGTLALVITLVGLVIPMPTVRAQDPNRGAIPVLYPNLTHTAVLISSYPITVSTVACSNTDTNGAFVQFFNTATPTVGTTTPLASIYLPATGGNNPVTSTPWTFDTALSIAATTTVTGSTSPTASTAHCVIAARSGF